MAIPLAVLITMSSASTSWPHVYTRTWKYSPENERIMIEADGEMPNFDKLRIPDDVGTAEFEVKRKPSEEMKVQCPPHLT